MRKICIIIGLLFLIPFCYSLEYYIDESISLSENGDAYIEGSTNLDFIKDIKPIDEKIKGFSSSLTSKKGMYWLFEFDPDKNISAALIKVTLPKGTVINYIKSPLSVSISSENDIITATFSDQDEKADIKIQYTISRNKVKSYLPIGIAIIAVITITTFFFIIKKKPKNIPSDKINQNKLSTIKPTLNETQIKIIDALLEKKGEASQTTIMYMTNLPKSSLSRNIEILAQKEIIQKFYNGTSNYIKIHPSMKK